MSEESTANDPPREDEVIFMAEGFVCERLDIPIEDAIVVLADMSVTRGLSLLDMAQAIVARVIDPGSHTVARRPAEKHEPDPSGD